MHHTKDKGDLGVFKVQSDLAEQGFMILHPMTEHAPFDLVVYKAGEFTRVQVKYRKKNHLGCIQIMFASSWSDKHGVHKKSMNKNEVDYVAVYCPDTDECYYFKPNDFGEEVTLRFEAARNGNHKNVHYAERYKVLGKFGSSPHDETIRLPYQPQPERRKVERPSRELLNSLLWTWPTTAIALQLGVSDNAVAKWARYYGLEKPPRGYWTNKDKGTGVPFA